MTWTPKRGGESPEAGAVKKAAYQFGGMGGAARAPEVDRSTVQAVPVIFPLTPKAARTWLVLQEPVSMAFPNETPLEDVLKYLKSATRGRTRRASSSTSILSA